MQCSTILWHALWSGQALPSNKGMRTITFGQKGSWIWKLEAVSARAKAVLYRALCLLYSWETTEKITPAACSRTPGCTVRDDPWEAAQGDILREGRAAGTGNISIFLCFHKGSPVWMNTEEMGTEEGYTDQVAERFVFLANVSDTGINSFSCAGTSHKHSKVCLPRDHLIWSNGLKNEPGDGRGQSCKKTTKPGEIDFIF